MTVELEKERNPIIGIILFLLIPVAAGFILWNGIPGSKFNGVRPGIFFPLQTELPEDARFMDNRIKCDSKEALTAVQGALRKVQPDYPVEFVTVQLDNYQSGYKFRVSYPTYYAQRLDFSAGWPTFRKGSVVGDADLEAQVRSKDALLEKTIRDALEAYFKSKGAH
ncbi:MAG: hypothetical protein ACKOIB_09085 [Verrucomicrobiota bacterium]